MPQKTLKNRYDFQGELETLDNAIVVQGDSILFEIDFYKDNNAYNLDTCTISLNVIKPDSTLISQSTKIIKEGNKAIISVNEQATVVEGTHNYIVNITDSKGNVSSPSRRVFVKGNGGSAIPSKTVVDALDELNKAVATNNLDVMKQDISNSKTDIVALEQKNVAIEKDVNNLNLKLKPTEDIILPREIKLLKGDSISKEQTNIYFDSLFLGDYTNVKVDSQFGKQLEECWRLETVSEGYAVPTVPFDLTVKAIDTKLQEEKSKTTNVELVENTDVVGKNRFNKDTTQGGYILVSNGGVSAHATYICSDFISIEPLTKYTKSGTDNAMKNHFAFYDKDKKYVASEYDTNNNIPLTFTTPSNAYFYRFTITNVANKNGIQLEKGDIATTFEAYRELSAPKYLLAIGDSITRDGSYLNHIQSKVKGVATVGTRQYTGETFAREGRGGWTLSAYLNNINATTSDSPFVFPTSVTGDKYKGNIRDWKAIVTDTTGYEWNGFQKIARGWQDTGEYLYDNNGYLKTPSVGDVMLDNSKPVGQKHVEWNGTAWVAMATQPTQFEFNFSKYMQRFSSAFVGKIPTHISLLFGANDFQTTNGLVNIDTWNSNLNKVIDSIKAYNNNIKIIICLPTMGSFQDSWGKQENCRATADNYNRNMKLLAQNIIKMFDNDVYKNRGIYITTFTSVVDREIAFDYIEENKNIYTATKVRRYNNWVHPNIVGHKQMGDMLGAVVKKY